MFEKLKGVEERFINLEKLLSDPAVISDQHKYQQYIKEHGELSKTVSLYRAYRQVTGQLEEARELLNDRDADIRHMAKEEIDSLKVKAEKLAAELRELMTPKDPRDRKNVILEIRAGTGGEEAGLFAGDLFRMYSRYAESKSWKTEIVEKNDSGAGGFKEIVLLIRGRNVFSDLKYESGIHRVQRVPETEAQGRVHTSAVTVAVLPEAEDVDVEINQNDLKIDVYRASGPGGQSVNTTDSAVRITHLPTGVVATCQDEKSQLKNKNKALNVLKARILDAKIKEQEDERSAERKDQVGTGDRSGRIRTYNFPQGRVTDHRINLTLYKLDQIMQGDIDPLVDELKTHYQAQALQEN